VTGSERSRVAQPATEEEIVLDLRGGHVDAILRRSPRARRLRLTVDARRGLIVTVPGGPRTDPRILRAIGPFAGEREAWIRRHLASVDRARDDAEARGPLADGSVIPFHGEPHRLRVVAAAARRRTSVARVGADDGDELVVTLAARDAGRLADVLEAWFRARARTAIERAATRHAAALGVAPAAVTIRDQRTRWGSASRSGRLSFSWRLVLAPPEALETVVVHELAHLRVFGHGPAFWDLVATRVPDHRRWRRWLRDHSADLHAVLAEG
jgi:predicted metal-dependent hydrolase